MNQARLTIIFERPGTENYNNRIVVNGVSLDPLLFRDGLFWHGAIDYLSGRRGTLSRPTQRKIALSLGLPVYPIGGNRARQRTDFDKGLLVNANA